MQMDEGAFSDGDGGRLKPEWLQSTMNVSATAHNIRQKGLYLWACGENKMRALSVQKKLDTIE